MLPAGLGCDATPTLTTPPPIERVFAEALALHGAGQLLAAEQACVALLRGAPAHAPALHLIGLCRLQSGDAAAALLCFDRAVAQDPGHAGQRSSRARALSLLGRHAEALAEHDASLALEAGHAPTWSNRAAALSALGDMQAARDSARRARALDPGLAAAWSNEGAALLALQQPQAALGAIEQALALAPHDTAAACNRVRALQALRRLPEALKAAWELTRLRPREVQAWVVATELLMRLRRWGDAAAAYEALLRLDPHHPFVEGRRLHALGKLCAWDDWDGRVQGHRDAIMAGRPAAEPFGLLALVDEPALQREAARLWVQRFERQPAQRIHPASAAPGARGHAPARPRIGWLSADFRSHPTAQLMAGVFEVFDRERFQSIALSLSPPSEDPMQARLRPAFDDWLELHALDDRAAAEAVAAAGIDLLVDLGGLTRGARPGLLALRPAPVQVAYLAYAGTTSMSTMDALIADEVVVPPEGERHFSERVVRLPGGFWPQDHRLTVATGTPERAALGLPDDGFVFCNFCDAAKLNPPIFSIWMRLLLARPDAVLWLLAGRTGMADNLRREAAQRGVHPSRLVFAERLPLADHLARHAAADLFVDTWPFNGHTTVADALWAGLPVLSLQGRALAARVASSQLLHLGLDDFVTRSAAEYEARALALAADPTRLQAVRQLLRIRRENHGRDATARFARGLESAFRTLIDEHHRGAQQPAGARAATSGPALPAC
jgi:protein O-GlcNAc transferase